MSMPNYIINLIPTKKIFIYYTRKNVLIYQKKKIVLKLAILQIVHLLLDTYELKIQAKNFLDATIVVDLALINKLN